MGKSTINGPFSIATLNYQRVTIIPFPHSLRSSSSFVSCLQVPPRRRARIWPGDGESLHFTSIWVWWSHSKGDMTSSRISSIYKHLYFSIWYPLVDDAPKFEAGKAKVRYHGLSNGMIRLYIKGSTPTFSQWSPNLINQLPTPQIARRKLAEQIWYKQ